MNQGPTLAGAPRAGQAHSRGLALCLRGTAAALRWWAALSAQRLGLGLASFMAYFLASIFALSPTPGAAESLTLSASSTQLARLAADTPTAALSFRIDSGARVLLVDIASGTSNLITSLELPGGVVVNENTVAGIGGTFVKADGKLPSGPLLFPFSGGGTHFIYRLPVATAGTLVVRFSAAVALTEDTAVATQVISDSTLGTALQFTEAVVVTGRPAVLAAAVFDGRQPVAGAQVVARVLSATGLVQTVVLRDDGADADGTAGDGLYSGLFVPPAPGVYRAAAEIAGRASGGDFVRHSGAVVEVVPSSGVLTGGVRGRGIDLNGNGALDRIAIDADLQAAVAGTYRLTVQISAAGKKLVGSGDVALTPGARTASATFDTQELVQRGLGQGPYSVDVVELNYLDNGRVLFADRKFDQGQIDFRNSVFERAALRLTGVSTNAGVDSNGNGLFDELRLSLQIDVQSAGNYAFSGRLADQLGSAITLYASSANLAAGLVNVEFRFSGRDIGARGLSGPYILDNLLVTDGANRSLSVAGAAAQTAAYSYTQFEGAARNPADLDNNGRVDCADVAIVRASYGRRTGQPGFDPRADVNRDGVVNLIDLTTVTRALPIGLVCP